MNIKSQRGLSLLGVLVVGALAAFVLIVAGIVVSSKR